MIPSLECEVQADLVTDLTFIRQEEYKFRGPVSLYLAKRAIKAYENMSRFDRLTGHIGDSIRCLFFAARYCIVEDYMNWTYGATDLVGRARLRKELKSELVRLCEEGIRLARKYGCEYVLLEKSPRQMLELYKGSS